MAPKEAALDGSLVQLEILVSAPSAAAYGLPPSDQATRPTVSDQQTAYRTNRIFVNAL